MNFFSRILNIFFIFILVFGVFKVVDAETVGNGSLAAYLDQERVPVGGVVWLTLDYRLPEGSQLPEKVEVKGLEGITILSQAVDSQQIRIQLLIDYIKNWRSDSIKLGYLNPEGETRFLTAEPVSVQVTSNISDKPEEADLRPIRDIDPTQSIWRRYMVWLAVIGALVLAGIGLFWWHRKRRSPVYRTEYVEPAHLRARRELRGLDDKQYFEKGLIKQHYFVFSEILKHYMASIRHFPAAEYTTEEIARCVTIEADRKLLSLLQQADLVKFADTVPSRARKESEMDAALAYIRETSPRLESVREQTRQEEMAK
jgi:hypothetical protein